MKPFYRQLAIASILVTGSAMSPNGPSEHLKAVPREFRGYWLIAKPDGQPFVPPNETAALSLSMPADPAMCYIFQDMGVSRVPHARGAQIRGGGGSLVVKLASDVKHMQPQSWELDLRAEGANRVSGTINSSKANLVDYRAQIILIPKKRPAGDPGDFSR